MMVKSVVGERRFAVLTGEQDLSGVDAHALLLVRMELSLRRKGREGVIEADGPLTVHLTVEDRTDSLVMRFGRPDRPSDLESSAAQGEAHPQPNPRLDVWDNMRGETPWRKSWSSMTKKASGNCYTPC